MRRLLAIAAVLGCGGSEPADTDSATETDPDATSEGTSGTTGSGPSTGPSSITTGESSSGGESSGESSGSTGDPPIDDACGEGEWTCIPVDPAGPYGSHSFEVPAAQNWVNTGLFLRVGEQATIDESGDWFVNAATGMPIAHGPCLVGDLVARIDLYYEDTNLTCVAGNGVVFTADKDGILFLGGLSGNDLGETYEARFEATGSKTVTVTSDGDTVPTVEAALAADYPFAEVASGRVEIRGAHTIVTLPAATAALDAAVVDAAVDRIDAMYELHEELRGAVPQHGQRIRFIADPNIVGIGYMLAGNPVRMDPVLVESTYANRISQAGMPGVDVWGFAHELGHDFTFVNAIWWYRENSLEAWPNIFSVHAFETLGLPPNPDAACEGVAPAPYATWDAWDGLCFLLQFQFAYGWEFYAEFFDQLNGTTAAEVPSGPAAWTFVHDRFEQIAGEDVTPIFVAWGVPNPG